MLSLLELPDQVLFNICKFFLCNVDYVNYSEYKRGFKTEIIDYQLVCRSFQNAIHVITRDDEYILLFLILGSRQGPIHIEVFTVDIVFQHHHHTIASSSISSSSWLIIENEEGDPIVFDISPNDDSWRDGPKIFATNVPEVCTDKDIEGIVKILTLNKRYALAKIRFNSIYIEKWLPQVTDLLERRIEENPLVSINTEEVEINLVHSDCSCCGGFYQIKQWAGDTNDTSGDFVSEQTENGENCLATVTKFVNLLKKQSNNECNFGNGLCCIECSKIQIYYKINFTAKFNKTAHCYYCECLILPHFKCLRCIIECNCRYSDEGGGDRCYNFCCNECAETQQINRSGWTAPECVIANNHDNEFNEDH